MPEKKQSASSGNANNVKVVVRCRPMSDKELDNDHKEIVYVTETTGTIDVRPPHNVNDDGGKTFTFDYVFAPNSKQVDIYNLVARPIVDAVLEGYNGTIFAYGQTGTGKTFTMEGKKDDNKNYGIILNSFAHVFLEISKASNDVGYLVNVSYLEIYNEEIRDLLGKDRDKSLDIKERPNVGVYADGLSAHACHSATEMESLMRGGSYNRHTGQTLMNERSSRSHAIFTITIECSDTGPDGGKRIRVGKLHMVDLAGSERQSKSGAEGNTLKEATKINLSLSTLGNVISALVDGKSTHIPYRNSKLTRLLQDSLGGNSKTAMIANIGPADYNYDETLSTLRYANRAKNIKNHARVNEDPKDAMIRNLENEIQLLRKQVEEGGGGVDDEEGSGSDVSDVDENGQRVMRKRPLRVRLERKEEIEREIEIERRKLQDDTEKSQKERDKIARALLEKQEELHAMKEQDDLQQKLRQLERKLIVGGENLLDKAQNQAKLLEESEQELQTRVQNEEQLRQQLIQKEAETLDVRVKYATLKEEAEDLTRKLKIFGKKYQESKRELMDLENENLQQRTELIEANTQAFRELQKQEFIIGSYIPEEYLKLIQQNAVWNEQFGEWSLKSIAYTGNNIKNKEKLKQDQNDDLNLTHVYLAYTAKGAEKAMRDFMERKKKTRAKDKKKKSAAKETNDDRPATAARN
ncbi:unnamed protein product [Rotaria magnacalcarata]|uniref:Kinesin-like protein n=7 Tax=Rotaria magnacalcarata TaxID=392030 RepID=A0A815U6C5_9BILA|nr:unnamed protein product [Rotaria magnacalcarata]CAF1514430.1 unnamed protein product [Rotaria magnacalcarata]CAF1938339.1 unnamed protein product [Rotaria magnacalcarata]CAF2052680.1 unnamed protein product [Rotaria magnacalcarata]CAF2142624.1 unnamed protein product [Rotaria magnacalcarata]